MVVLEESYGLMLDFGGAEKLREMYAEPAVLNKYEVQTGTVEFHGATVSGEFRILCGLEAGIRSLTLIKDLSGQCLPKLLEKRGYTTTAIHGFLGAMFDREKLVPGSREPLKNSAIHRGRG
jgi:hypothetical protein